MADPVLPPEFLARGPIIIGATGGSGTRVIAKILRDCGVYMGKRFTPALDAVEVGRPAARWIDKYMASELNGETPPSIEEMAADLKPIFENHLTPIRENPRKWGWKSPRSIYLLPFYHAIFPAMRFIHVVRDGRDMAFSTNQHQLRDHGHVVLRDLPPDTSEPVRAMTLWTRINLPRAEFGERELRDRYLRIRFEDLCANSAEVISKLLRFIEASGDAEKIAQDEVAPPDSIGRWRTQDRQLIAELNRVGGAALLKFGYV
ncbi:MAG: sulfotransferase [Spartobacteria bacterium]